jgi:LPXTG-motif cell wall-anchored protein
MTFNKETGTKVMKVGLYIITPTVILLVVLAFLYWRKKKKKKELEASQTIQNIPSVETKTDDTPVDTEKLADNSNPVPEITEEKRIDNSPKITKIA